MRKEIIKGCYDKHWQECTLNVYVEIKPLFVYPRKRTWYNDTFYHNANEEKCVIELFDNYKYTLKITGY